MVQTDIGGEAPSVETLVLSWGINESLVSYIRALDDGIVETACGAIEREPGVFSFPIDASASQWNWRSAAGTLRFSGEVRLAGHQGTLDVSFRSPWVTIIGDTGRLSLIDVAVEPPADGSPITDRIGFVELTPIDPTAGTGQWNSRTALTRDGADWFLHYAVGQQFAPVSLHW